MALYNGTEHYVMMGLQGIELVTNTLLTCPCSAINFILILRTSILHPNLKFILLSQSLSIFTRGIGRWWMSWNALLTGNEVWMSGYQWNQVYLFASQFRQFLAHVLIVERLMATVFVQNYENWRKPYFSLIWLIILTIWTLSNTLNPSGMVSRLWTWNITFVLTVAECLLLQWLWRLNDRIFGKKYVDVQNLSVRFQLAENIRTGRQLLPTLLLHFSLVVLATGTFYINMFSLIGSYTEHPFAYGLINQLYSNALSTISFFIELTMILFHPYLRRDLMNALNALKQKVCNALLYCYRPQKYSSRVSPISMPKAANKEIVRMNIRGSAELLLPNSGRTEADEYFDQLKMSWERFESRKK